MHVVEKKDKLCFYLNSGVKTLETATVFSDDEEKYCEEFANASTTGKNFEEYHDHYIKLLLNQFPIKNIKPFSHEIHCSFTQKICKSNFSLYKYGQIHQKKRL